jgi:hypothetical protein
MSTAWMGSLEAQHLAAQVVHDTAVDADEDLHALA